MGCRRELAPLINLTKERARRCNIYELWLWQKLNNPSSDDGSRIGARISALAFAVSVCLCWPGRCPVPCGRGAVSHGMWYTSSVQGSGADGQEGWSRGVVLGVWSGVGLVAQRPVHLCMHGKLHTHSVCILVTRCGAMHAHIVWILRGVIWINFLTWQWRLIPKMGVQNPCQSG